MNAKWNQKGDWKDLYPKKPGNPQQGEVFNLWFDHGETPENQTYAYIMVPDAKATDMPGLAESDIKILGNTADLQAISVDGGTRIQAVFYAPGDLAWAKGQTLSTDTPCLLMVDGERIFVSDPTQKKKQVQLTINGRTIPVRLPAGGYAGRTVEVTVGLKAGR